MTKHVSIKSVSVLVCMEIQDVVKMPNVMIKIIVLSAHVLLEHKAIHLFHVFVVFVNIMKIARIMKPAIV